MDDIFKELLKIDTVVRYCGYREFVEIYEIYVIIKTNHDKGNLAVTLRPTSDFIKDNLNTPDIILSAIKWQLDNIQEKINNGDTSFIGN